MVEAPIFHVERRRSGSRGVRRQGRDRVPAEIPEAGGHRHVLLPRLRPQRGRRAGVHPAADVQGHPRASERRRRSTPRRLVSEGVLSEGDVEKMRADWRAKLDVEFEASQGYKANSADWLDGRWSDIKAARDQDDPRRGHTGVDIATLKEIGDKITTVPKGFHVHRTIQRFLDNRRKAIETGEGIDWATAEALALLHAPARRSSGAALRPGCRARHVLAAALRAGRPGERGSSRLLQPHTRAAGPLRGRQLDALGGGRARLRIRLLAVGTECADAVGGAVRRLRQRRAGGVRPVRLLGRAQVAAHVRARVPPAARLRRAGAGALLGPARALPADVRRGQHAGRQHARRRPTISTRCAGSSSATSANP